MKRFKNILLYAGGEVSPQPAIDRAAALAQANDARLTLVDVLPEEPTGPWMALPGRSELERTLVVARGEELEDLAAPVREQGIGVETRVLTGRPFVELIHEVQRREHDLVMKTAQGPGGGVGGVLGSTALHLLRKCPSPVWVVEPREVARGSVVAAIDPAVEDPAGDSLSKAIVELASSLARSRNLELYVVHAWRLWSESMLRGPRVNMPKGQVDNMVEETRRAAEAAVRGVLANVDLSGISVRLHIVQGTPFEVVSRISRHADVAVLGTLSRAGIAGVLIGNTAERVLRQLDCSVLAVKPEGFESPVQLPSENLEKIV